MKNQVAKQGMVFRSGWVMFVIFLAFLNNRGFSADLDAEGPSAEPVKITWYVSLTGNGQDGTTWETAFTDIKTAIAIAESGETIIVGPGKYRGQGNTNLSFGGKSITLRSIDPGDAEVVATTIIDCESKEHTRAFTFTHTEGPDAVLDGLTIRNGRGRITSYLGMCVPTGGAIFCCHAHPTIRHCIFQHNTAQSGGAIFCRYSNPTISHCVIIENTGADGGGITCYRGNPTIRHCVIAGNIATDDGGGIYNHGSAPRFSHCQITNNFAGDVGGGVGATQRSSLMIYNCTFSLNAALHGGAISLWLSNAKVCNTILWGNEADHIGPEIYTASNSANKTLTVSYCNVQNGREALSVSEKTTLVWGRGNIQMDPRFVDVEKGDFHLLADSPCIDAGDNLMIDWAFDLDGEMRMLDGNGDGEPVVDMGVDEFLSK